METPSAAEPGRSVIFRLGWERYGLPLAAVLEVLDSPAGALRPLPGAPDWVAGVLSHQGHVRAVVRTAALVAGEDRWSQAATGQIILAELGGERLGLLVDQVEGVEVIRTAGPAREDGRRHAWHHGVLVILLDLGELARAIDTRARSGGQKL
ncbi:MAG TPA: chemotaxis protein CheW [Myxococcota bacterium]|nr:chemotaxis protein CheW [Myxococcota bacterium]HRY95639.1 chemotaxis protein CheW [Myxococcota bacterium]HSA20336.1 chemotaxis protein CheW [Myxococcota bacterium]